MAVFLIRFSHALSAFGLASLKLGLILRIKISHVKLHHPPLLRSTILGHEDAVLQLVATFQPHSISWGYLEAAEAALVAPVFALRIQFLVFLLCHGMDLVCWLGGFLGGFVNNHKQSRRAFEGEDQSRLIKVFDIVVHLQVIPTALCLLSNLELVFVVVA